MRRRQRVRSPHSRERGGYAGGGVGVWAEGHRATLYQQLSTVSRDYMTVYSITTPTDHTPQHLIDHTPQHLTDDTPQQSTDQAPQQQEQSTVEPDQPPDHTQPVIKHGWTGY